MHFQFSTAEEHESLVLLLLPALPRLVRWWVPLATSPAHRVYPQNINQGLFFPRSGPGILLRDSLSRFKCTTSFLLLSSFWTHRCEQYFLLRLKIKTFFFAALLLWFCLGRFRFFFYSFFFCASPAMKVKYPFFCGASLLFF